MDPIRDIPNVNNANLGISNIRVNGTGIRFIGNVNPRSATVRDVTNFNIADTRTWIINPSHAVPVDVPVTTIIGIPIVDMPGCVKVHKENTGRDPSANKQLVNDDPKGNVVLCDSGMPYYEPPDYDYRDLSWTTVYMPPEEENDRPSPKEPPPPETPGTPEPPTTPPTTKEEVECPPPNARRIGDLNQAGTERVKEYRLIKNETVCETVWEPIPFVDKYLPSPAVVTTTATIAAVATTSALLAKPLADLLLKVVKPVVKKAIGKVKALMGKKEPVLSTRERLLAQRERNRAIMELRKSLKK